MFKAACAFVSFLYLNITDPGDEASSLTYQLDTVTAIVAKPS